MALAVMGTRGMQTLAILGRCMRASFRVLVPVCDLYVSWMAACASDGGRYAPVPLVAIPT
uniref:Uncharacterized protein n=1 Tax=Oryza punctata TaxID=4537 RepID=A0A0E0LMZ9_ORYPU